MRKADIFRANVLSSEEGDRTTGGLGRVLIGKGKGFPRWKRVKAMMKSAGKS